MYLEVNGIDAKKDVKNIQKSKPYLLLPSIFIFWTQIQNISYDAALASHDAMVAFRLDEI